MSEEYKLDEAKTDMEFLKMRINATEQMVIITGETLSQVLDYMKELLERVDALERGMYRDDR